MMLHPSRFASRRRNTELQLADYPRSQNFFHPLQNLALQSHQLTLPNRVCNFNDQPVPHQADRLRLLRDLFAYSAAPRSHRKLLLS